MREQVIAHKVGNRSGLSSHRRSTAATQRPARRESTSEAIVARLRAIVGYIPTLLKIVVAIIIGIVLFAGYRAAASASFFQVHKIEVGGTSRVSADEVQSIVRHSVEKTGVWRADLKAINTELEKLPWVKTAIVSRVLPDGMRVRITERTAKAVVRTASGRFRWIDEDAVLLGEMLPTDQIPAFFMRGLNEDDPEGARQENRDRVARFLELQRDWDASGLSERVSEVNLIDLKDVRAQLAGDDSHIEIRLGAQDFDKRLKDALEVLDTQKQSPRGSLISYIDLSQGKRAIVGLTTGAHTGDGPAPSKPTDNASKATSNVPALVTTAAPTDQPRSDTSSRNERTKSAAADKKSEKQKQSDKRKRPSEEHR